MQLGEYEYAILRKIDFNEEDGIPSFEELEKQDDIKHGAFGLGVCKAGLFPMVFKSVEMFNRKGKKIADAVRSYRFDRNSMTLGELGGNANEHKGYYYIIGHLPLIGQMEE